MTYAFKTLVLFSTLLLFTSCAMFSDNPGPASSTPTNGAPPPDNGQPAGPAQPAQPGQPATRAAIPPEQAMLSTVMAAITRQDWAYLGSVCTRQVNKNHVVDKACKAWVDHYKDTKDVKMLSAICHGDRRIIPRDARSNACWAEEKYSAGNWGARLPTCETLAEDYKALRKKYAYSNRFPIYMAAAKKAIACKDWNYFWGDLLNNRGRKGGFQSSGFKVLKRLDKQNVAFLESLETYLKSNAAPFSSRLGCNAVEAVTLYMVYKKLFENSHKYLKYMKKLTGCGKAKFGTYYRAARTKKAVPFFYKQLLSTDPNTKAAACLFLGDFGTKRHIKRMRIIAQTDPTFKIQHRVKIYWVRDTCKGAIGRIRMR